MKKILFVLGGPGSGKGTICQIIKQKLGFQHISVGEVIRKYMNDNPECPKTLEYKDTLTNGCCIPASESIHFLMSVTNNMYKDEENALVLIDGYPRSLEQLEVYNKISGMSFGGDNDVGLLYVNTPDEVMRERMTSRGRDFRDGDNEIIKKRIDYYYNETIPVIKKIKSDCAEKIIELNGLNNPEDNLELFRQIIK